MRRDLSVNEIQEFYDAGHTLSQAAARFTFASVRWAQRHGLVTRSKSESAAMWWRARKKPKIVYTKCEQCDRGADRRFCSRRCSSRYSGSRVKNRNTDGLAFGRHRPQRRSWRRQCSVCGTIMEGSGTPVPTVCSDKCRKAKASSSGRKAAQSQNRRSKNEALFADMCSQQFADAVFNVPMFDGWDADVILPSLRVAVLWNGPWHYKQISRVQSLAQVQKRDEIKIAKIHAHGYRPIVIRDDGKFNPKFVRCRFSEFLAQVSEVKITPLSYGGNSGENPLPATI